MALVADSGGGVPGRHAAVDLLTDTLPSHLSDEKRELMEPLVPFDLH